MILQTVWTAWYVFLWVVHMVWCCGVVHMVCVCVCVCVCVWEREREKIRFSVWPDLLPVFHWPDWFHYLVFSFHTFCNQINCQIYTGHTSRPDSHKSQMFPSNLLPPPGYPQYSIKSGNFVHYRKLVPHILQQSRPSDILLSFMLRLDI